MKWLSMLSNSDMQLFHRYPVLHFDCFLPGVRIKNMYTRIHSRDVGIRGYIGNKELHVAGRGGRCLQFARLTRPRTQLGLTGTWWYN